MKLKLLLILFLFSIAYYSTKTSFAQTNSSPSANQELIEKLTTKIASQTAQKKLVEKRGIIGTVTDATQAQVTIIDLMGNTRFIDVDELTKFSSFSDKSFGISDVNKGMTLGAVGLYNKDSRRILARKINQLTPFPKVIYGAIINTNDEAFEITISDEKKKKIVVEIQDITKTTSYTQGEFVKSGFSKITPPQNAIIIGFPDKQNPNKILVTRLILLPDIKVSDKIDLTPIISPADSKNTTSSAKKLTN